jgi:hypothetical protein
MTIVNRRAILLATCLAGLALAGTAAGSCIPMTAAQQRARADLIFDGVALDGPTGNGIQRFRVLRYRKGTGARVLLVRTGRTKTVITSVSVNAARGQTWRIFARRLRSGLYETNVCDGSRRLR